MLKFALAAIAALALTAPALADIVTIQTSGTTSSLVTNGAVETFSNVPTTGRPTSFTTVHNGVSFDYEDVYVNTGDQFGITPNNPYAAAYNGPVSNNSTYWLYLKPDTFNYFGLYISATDASNSMTFYSGEERILTFNASTAVPSSGAFVNFNFGAQTFDAISFSAGAGTGFESDNHTVAQTVAAVPEASTWAIMVIGLGAVGGTMRASKRRRQPSLAIANA